MEADIPEWNFEDVRADATKSWNEYLSKIDIETADKDQQTMFYTALYHTGVQPIFSQMLMAVTLVWT